MSDAQPELGLFKASEDDPNVLWLEKYLKECGEWVTAAGLVLRAGRALSDDNRRWVRALAEASDRIISGQKGYKHLERATAEEVRHFVNWMESQGRKMIGRAERLKRNAHAIFG
jgi:hypothetical protein